MFNSGILDTLIACVVVILVLSLIVQAIQTGIKKLFKLKSRQIEDSLVDLFQTILNQSANTVPASFRERAALYLGFKHSSEMATADVQSLYQAVTKRFVELGRVSSSGQLMLDTLEKSDLLKVLGKIAPGTLVPNLLKDVQDAVTQLGAIEAALQSIDQAFLSGDASARFAAFQSAFSPLFNDFLTIASGGNVNANLLIQDIARLREINLGTATTLLGDIQTHVAGDLAAARKATPPDAASIQGLAGLAGRLNNIAAGIAKFQSDFDAAISPLRTMLAEVENWFDTVVNSFDERYNRAMKTWATGLSFAVVVCLNANVFDLYRNVTRNTTLRNMLVNSAPGILENAKKATPVDAQNAGAASDSTSATKDTPKTGAGDTQPTVQTIAKQTETQIRPYLDDYDTFGFHPFLPAFADWWKNSFMPQRPIGAKAWWGNRVHDFFHILGWAIMALLLSVGAPFWEDMLESLFGVKNLIRSGGKSNDAPSSPMAPADSSKTGAA
jgi:hypothetical protein